VPIVHFQTDRRKNRERRGAERAAESGRVRIWFENPARVDLEAEWIETSATGFRLAHDSDALEAGLEVSYESQEQFGRARVVWTHVLDGRRVSGFVRLG
jgi:hypothetical protein